MIWTDLAIISICLWGGVAGYFKGIRRMVVKIAFLFAAIIIANIFKKHVSVYLAIVFDFEYKIKEVIFNKFVIPVMGIINNFNGDYVRENIYSYIENLSLPASIENEIMEQLENMPGKGDDILYFVDMFADLFVNVISFFLAFLMWAGSLFVVNIIVSERLSAQNPGGQSPGTFRGCLKNGGMAGLVKAETASSSVSRWGGALLGILRHFLVISLVVGVFSVMVAIFPVLSLVMNIDESVLGVLSLKAFDLMGVW